jgi:hypothetical protein
MDKSFETENAKFVATFSFKPTLRNKDLSYMLEEHQHLLYSHYAKLIGYPVRIEDIDYGVLGIRYCEDEDKLKLQVIKLPYEKKFKRKNIVEIIAPPCKGIKIKV